MGARGLHLRSEVSLHGSGRRALLWAWRADTSVAVVLELGSLHGRPGFGMMSIWGRGRQYPAEFSGWGRGLPNRSFCRNRCRAEASPNFLRASPSWVELKPEALRRYLKSGRLRPSKSFSRNQANLAGSTYRWVEPNSSQISKNAVAEPAPDLVEPSCAELGRDWPRLGRSKPTLGKTTPSLWSYVCRPALLLGVPVAAQRWVPPRKVAQEDP